MWFDITTYVIDNHHMLNLHSQARQRLLRYYFTNPTARLHLRDLTKRLDSDPSNLSKELRHLEIEGLFTSETSGRQKYFSLNREISPPGRGPSYCRKNYRSHSPTDGGLRAR